MTLRRLFTTALLCALALAAYPVRAQGGTGFAETPRLDVAASSSGLLGDPVTIRATGLRPGAPYSLRLTIRDYWGSAWVSRATFLADAHGTVDIARDAPIAGSYGGVDPLGLFWAGETSGSRPEVTRSTPPNKSVSLAVQLREGTSVVAGTDIELWLMSPNVTRRVYEGPGVRGVFYEPAERSRNVGVVLLGGSGGGLNWQEVTAAALASRGFPALALGYFNLEGLPGELEMIPIEGVLEAAATLPRLGAAKVNRVVLAGLSKGAELALLAASRSDVVDGVIAFAPSFTVFQSFPSLIKGTAAASSWSIDGQPVPFTPLVREQPFAPSESGDRAWHEYLVLNAEAAARAAIPVERVRGPILLFSGAEDRIWPSRLMADKVIARLRQHKVSHDYRHIAFDDVGHAFATPGYLPTGRTVLNNGGSARATAWAQVNSWAAVQRFLDTFGDKTR